MKAYIQRLGRALMLPVACLPAAALFLGIGYWIDPSGWGGGNVIAAYLCKTGSAILDNLGLLFAVGVAVGMARDKDGASALSGLVGFMTITTIMGSASMFLGFDAENPPAAFAPGAIGNKNVFFGIMVGCVSGALYNRFSKTKLPDFLAFFSGRRCVPILTAALMSVISLVLLFVWPLVYNGLVAFGESLMGMGAVGAGIYAFFNRLLIPTGLHHALNNVFWFNLAGIDDITKFWNGVGGLNGTTKAVLATGGFQPWGEYVTGMYQAGFFPIMMFGLPAGAFAIYRCAKPENRRTVRLPDARRWSGRLPHRCDRAPGVLLHVRRLPAVRGARAAHRPVGVHRRVLPVDRRLQLLRRLHRLVPLAACAAGAYAVDAYRAGPGLCGHLLLRVHVHDQEVRPQDPGPWRWR